MQETLSQISEKLWQVGDHLSAYDRGFYKEEVWGMIDELRDEVLALFDTLPEETQAQLPRLMQLKEGKIDVIGAWSFGVDEVQTLVEHL